ncbi:hypothetical protein BGZ92_001085 [Podila epicladia]|nr:hypothetical protein BGZ92_001085 [Podila epicladia]
MEVDKTEVVLLDGLSPTANTSTTPALTIAPPSPSLSPSPLSSPSPSSTNSLSTSTSSEPASSEPVTPTDSPTIFPNSVPYIHTTVFATAPESGVIDPTDTHSDTKFKIRLQKFIIRTPPNIAQTHLRMAPIKQSIGRAEKRLPLPLAGRDTSSNTSNSGSNQITSTDSEELNRSTGATIGATNPDSGHLGGSIDGSENAGSTEDLSLETGTTAAIGTREGFTVSGSLFAKVKRVLHQKQFAARSSKGSNGMASTVAHGEEVIVVGGPDGDSDAGSSSSGNSGSDGNSSTTNNTSATSNDSSSTVADLNDSGNRLRQRKYSFGSRRNSVAPAPSTLELSSSPTTVISIPTSLQMEGLTAGIEVTILEEITQANDPVVQDVKTKEQLAQENPQHAHQDEKDEAVDPIPLFQEVLRRQHKTEAQIVESLQCLRQLILAYGIPDDPKQPSIRGQCWKLLLEVNHVSAQEYVSLVKRGKPDEYGKIRNDTFRTLATDKKFLDVVDEDSLIRVLCAFAWSTQATSYHDTDVSFTYVQGMNVLAAPFLYTMSEMEAFYSYSNFIKYCCPLYVQPALQGVHCGIKLLEECLRKIDVELYNHLKSKRLSAELYAFPSVLTICACTPPLDQAMQLWDFLLAWGIHLNIICIIAQMHLIRGDLMSHQSPMKLLRIFPDLDADKIIGETIKMVKLLPDELYDLLVRHPYDPSVAEQISW